MVILPLFMDKILVPYTGVEVPGMYHLFLSGTDPDADTKCCVLGKVVEDDHGTPSDGFNSEPSINTNNK